MKRKCMYNEIEGEDRRKKGKKLVKVVMEMVKK